MAMEHAGKINVFKKKKDLDADGWVILHMILKE